MPSDNLDRLRLGSAPAMKELLDRIALIEARLEAVESAEDADPLASGYRRFRSLTPRPTGVRSAKRSEP
jgi:hypothetical protein